MDLSKNVLIIGGDSFIGTGIATRFSVAGVHISVTTRRFMDKEKVFLDLFNWKHFSIPRNIDAAILCAGMSGFSVCETSREAEQVNTVFLPALAARLIREGIFTILLSSSAVFADDLRLPAEDAPLCPATAYGRQKALAEQKVRQSADMMGTVGRLCIVRLTKVVDAVKSPVAAWLQSWEAGKAARAFSDIRTSPITLEYLFDALRRIVSEQKAGIWHLSGEAGISYAEICSRLARSLNEKPEMVETMTADETGFFAPFRPVDGALDMTHTTRETGIVPLPIDNVLNCIEKQVGKDGR